MLLIDGEPVIFIFGSVGVPVTTCLNWRVSGWRFRPQTHRTFCSRSPCWPCGTFRWPSTRRTLPRLKFRCRHPTRGQCDRSGRFGPSFSWRLFDAGAIRGNIKVQTVLQEQLRRASRVAGRAVHLYEQQYRSGLIDFTSVLDAQRSQLSFQEQLAVRDGTVTGNLVRLYKALGGGWSPLNLKEQELQ